MALPRVTTKENAMNNTKSDINVNRNYKSSLFHKIFGQNKKNALSLYNAMNGSSYTNEDDLEFTTLEDVIYLKMKNDVSFLLGTSLSLYEHQSSFNPNMPLRGFLYFADLYRKMIKNNERIYSKQLARIPNPKYIVFYNGLDSKIEGMQKLKLSDAFETQDNSGEFEWTATMVNINLDHNRDIFEKCRILEEYSIFIQRVREYNKNSKDLKDAVNQAVDDCIRDNVLKDILETQKKEGINMVLTEFDEEKFEAIMREDGKLQALGELVCDGVISLKEALRRTGMSEKEFKEATKYLVKWNKD